VTRELNVFTDEQRGDRGRGKLTGYYPYLPRTPESREVQM
jgi:predicted dithiol-disulfide oxidoreductase (DUF899 family)